MDPSELLQLVTGILERLGFRYLVTGSTATIFFGEPRFTDKHLRDIAGVFKISGEQIDRGYLEEWVSRLGLQEVWSEVLGRLSSGPDS